MGLKIDYLIKRLGQAFASHGFKRKGRKLLRQAGEGAALADHQCPGGRVGQALREAWSQPLNVKPTIKT